MSDPLDALVKLARALPRDLTHDVGVFILRTPLHKLLLRDKPVECTPVEVGGVRLNPPVGVAAGLDKNGELIEALYRIGVGFVVIGTALPRKRKGNKRPRIVQIGDNLVNAMGLPSKGLDYVLSMINRARRDVVLSIGGFDVDDFITVALRAGESRYVKALEVNISSPTYRGTMVERAEELLRELNKVSTKPMWLKVPPNLPPSTAVRLTSRYCSALVAVNTLPVRAGGISVEVGGLSGDLLYKFTKYYVKRVRSLDKDLHIVAVGGLIDVRRICEVFKLGANAVELLTGIVLKGPRLVRDSVMCYKYTNGNCSR